MISTTSRSDRVAVFVAFAIWLAWQPYHFARPTDRKTILVLHTYGQVSDFRAQFDQALHGALRRNGLGDADMYVETLESGRFAGKTQAALFRRYLAEKYANARLDVVVTIWDRALNYALEHRDELFPNVPLVSLVTRERTFQPDDRIAQVTAGSHIADTVGLALRLHSNTRRIVVVDGTLESSDDVQKEITDQLEPLRQHVVIEYLRDLPVDDVRERVKSLPEDSFILFARQTLKTRTQAMTQLEGLTYLSGAARVPIYTSSDQFIGPGAVGGVVYLTDAFAELVAETANRVTNGPLASDFSTRKARTVPMFDWRQLRRWGIQLGQLPGGSEVRFREYRFWEQNQNYVLGALAVFLIQSSLIAGLLIQGARRRRAERALRTNEQALLVSHEDTRRLAGRLIAAQEVERARIARELHDDISQKVALLAMDIHQVSHSAAPGILGRVNTIAERAAEIATDLHNLSHELHPAKLQILGLVQATQYFCRDVAARHQLTIEFVHDRMPANVPAEPALCLFRIVQEALQNVVKHSGARNAAVKLTGADRSLQLVILDSGAGFDTGALEGGIGLLSMRERVYLLGGDMDIWSKPGSGTQISVQVPFEPSAATADRSVTRIA
jgi:signal transduction histidine kinase